MPPSKSSRIAGAPHTPVRRPSRFDTNMVPSMSDFAAYVTRFIASALERTPATTARDVYVVSLYVEDRTNRDPRSPQVEIGFNTQARAAETTPGPGQAPGWPIASDAAEARWNLRVLAAERSRPPR